MVELRGPGHEADLKEATILLYSPAPDPYLQKITELADRLFCIYGACRETGRKRRALGLETAKEILAEVFRARPGEVKDMIQRRLEESGLEER